MSFPKQKVKNAPQTGRFGKKMQSGMGQRRMGGTSQ
jgi:hypothetical protein